MSHMRPLRLGETVLDFSRPYVMGIVYVTPDSFSDGGLFADPGRAALHAEELVEEGADIIDVGGESTRPGAPALSVEEELARVLPVIKRLTRQLKVPVSIDTYKAKVAEAAVGEGAAMVNDISTLGFDPLLAETVARLGVPIAIMHTTGRPEVMQSRAVTGDVVGEVLLSLSLAVGKAEAAGVDPGAILIDP